MDVAVEAGPQTLLFEGAQPTFGKRVLRLMGCHTDRTARPPHTTRNPRRFADISGGLIEMAVVQGTGSTVPGGRAPASPHLDQARSSLPGGRAAGRRSGAGSKAVKDDEALTAGAVLIKGDVS